MGQSVKGAGGMCVLALALSGCMSDIGERYASADLVTRFRLPGASQAIRPTYAETITADSPIIQGLAMRTSVLPANSVAATVASSVLAANSRTAESEVRAATLRSEAASKN